MPFSLVPKLMAASIYRLKPKLLQEKGIRVLFADLDNTLARYSEKEPSEKLKNWITEMENSGITVFVLSNSRKSTRANQFCEAIPIPYSKHSGKPKKKGFIRAAALYDVSPEETAIVGDQIFTDVLGGNRFGSYTILVHPIAIDNIFRAIRYAFETLFRIPCKDKSLWK